MNRRILAVMGKRGRSFVRRSVQLWLGDDLPTGRYGRGSGCPFVDDLGLPSLTRR
ncbi:MAG: hypothetical protein M0Z91_06375 [Actinomycetota bacterium]|nr:hypothetical protein [Actinomycetota bacterium]